jgi:hypothetical protein
MIVCNNITAMTTGKKKMSGTCLRRQDDGILVWNAESAKPEADDR